MAATDPLADTLDTAPLARALADTVGGDDPAARVTESAEAVEKAVIGLRRWFHAHPEASLEERRTATAIAAQLEALGIECSRPLENAVVATVRGTAPDAYGENGEPCRRVLLRADIDALPVTEDTGLPFSSTAPGLMHACGHDCHAAMLLGAAAVLQANRDLLAGEARLVFQPAEECSRGARMLVDAGVCDGVDAAWGCHIWSELPSGTVSVQPGPRMANADWWRVEVTGTSAHGALPHRGADAVVAGAAIVEQLQTVVSRQVSPFEPVVVTVGQFHGGTAKNVIAGSAWLEGTVRTFDPEVHARVPLLMKRVVEDTAEAFGCTARVTEYTLGSWAVVNDPAVTEVARKAAAEVLGEAALVDYRGSMPGEDFSEYLFEVPGCFVFLGCSTTGTDHCWPQHSCHYNPDESVLASGVKLAAQFAVDYLAG